MPPDAPARRDGSNRARPLTVRAMDYPSSFARRTRLAARLARTLARNHPSRVYPERVCVHDVRRDARRERYPRAPTAAGVDRISSHASLRARPRPPSPIRARCETRQKPAMRSMRSPARRRPPSSSREEASCGAHVSRGSSERRQSTLDFTHTYIRLRRRTVRPEKGA